MRWPKEKVEKVLLLMRNRGVRIYAYSKKELSEEETMEYLKKYEILKKNLVSDEM